MGKELSFITSLHIATKRNYLKRMNDEKVKSMKIARKYSKDYWDGNRKYGYGGYKFIPGYWTKVAKKIIKKYKLSNNSKILDIGCGKGFLLYEIKSILKSIDIVGIDISSYAILNSKKKLNNYIAVGVRINFPNENLRNHDKISIKKFIKYIRGKKINKNKKILLISDKKNSIKLKQIFKLDKNIFFSKDYTKSFLEDGFYILNCDNYYQFYGTGISVFAEFSKIKFEIFTDLKRGFLTRDVIRSDQLYDTNKKNSWQTKYQKFININ
ncbi:class I SAM-dependent methyltransferase [Candidatus Pelagibacter sp.]|nr:class I SAM-dependent methyltransferase [Candidatus Pelagibacter sp.]